MKPFVFYCILLFGVGLIDCRKPWLIEKVVKVANAQSENAHEDIGESDQVNLYQDIDDSKTNDALPADNVDNLIADSYTTMDTIFCSEDIDGDNMDKRKMFQYLEFYYDLYLKTRSWLLYFYELSTAYILAQFYYYWEVFVQYVNICVAYVQLKFKEFAWKYVLLETYKISLEVFHFCSVSLVTIVLYFRHTDFQQIIDIINPDSHHWLVPIIKITCLFCFVATLIFSARNDRNTKAISRNKKKEASRPVPEGIDGLQLPIDGPKLVIFSGGSAVRELCKQISMNLSRKVTYILPISDDGGSSKEIIKVIGGPAIGDIRNRLNSLADDSTEENRAIKRLLDYRLDASDLSQARDEISSIIAGEHPLWSYHSLENGTQQIKDAKKQPIISFLSHFYESVLTEISRSNENSSANTRGGNRFGIATLIGLLNPISYSITPDSNSNTFFDFRGGSIGNFVLSGARLFMKSLDAAITWYSEIISIPKHTQILPIITPSSLKEKVQICALLSDGKFIYGQSEISHPYNDKNTSVAKLTAGNMRLHSPIKQLFYCDSNNSSTILPKMNSLIVKYLNASETVVYGMGSFYTSIVALLVVPGVGSAIKALSCPKVIVINGYPDRETFDMKLLDYIGSLIGAMKQSEGDTIPISSMFRYLSELGSNEIKKYVTHVCYIDAPVVASTIVPPDQLQILQTLGIKTVAVPPATPSQGLSISKTDGSSSDENRQHKHTDSLGTNLESQPRARTPTATTLPHSVYDTKYCSFPTYDNEKLLLEIKRIAENHKAAERKKRSFPEFDD